MFRHHRLPLVFVALVYLFSGAPVIAGPPQWLTALIDSSKTLTFSSDATSAVLLHDRHAELGGDGTVRTHVRYVVKVLKSEGAIEAMVKEGINATRSVDDFAGWLVTVKGEFEPIKKENTATVAATNVAGMYDDARVLIVAAGDLDPGVIAAYEYTTVEKDGWTGLYQVMVFQTQQPVHRASYSIRTPSPWKLHYSLRNADSCRFDRTGNVYTWVMTDLAYRAEEPFMPSWVYVARRLLITGGDTTSSGVPSFTNWDQAGKWYGAVFAKSARASDAIIQAANERTASLATTPEKVAAIAEFVQNDIRYVAMEMGKGRFQPRVSDLTLTNRFGDCKDKVALLHSLLQPLGVTAAPVLASVGTSVDPSIPSPLQFNHCIIALPQAEIEWTDSTSPARTRDWLLFDPTAEGIPLGKLPMGLYGTPVLMITPDDSDFVRLPGLTVDNNRRRLAFDGHVDEQGRATAHVVMAAYGPVAQEAKHLYASMPENKQIEEFNQLVGMMFPGAVVDSFARQSFDDSLITKFIIKPTPAVSRFDELAFLSVYPLGDDKPTRMKAGKREHPIWFGPAMRIDYDIVWTLDPVWEIDGQYPPIDGAVDSCHFSATTEITDHRIEVRATMRRDGHLIDQANYDSARLFRKAYDAFLGYRIAVKGS